MAARLYAEQPLPQIERLKSSPVLRQLERNPLKAAPRNGAEETVAQMYVLPGFRAELVVAEPELHQPIAFAFDERGRIWVAEAHSYPQKRTAGEGRDQIMIFEDADGDGGYESRKVFAEGLNLVSGFEVGYGGVWVGAAPELLFIPDRNKDDRPDGAPEVLLDGFGYQDTHECLNSFLWGPDGWLYGNQGVFNYSRIGQAGAPVSERQELRAGVWRYHPVRKRFEAFAHGGSNQWGLDYDERGQLFMTHCRSYWGRGGTTHVLQGGHFWNQANANYPPFIVANPPAEFAHFRNYLLASARYDHGAGGAGEPGSDLIYGGHSHVGTMIYLGDNWPDEFRGHLFTHNLHGHQINHQVNRPLGSGFDTVHGGHDQLFCSDPKYVAVDLQYGPDGAVYTIDWYDQQHCHNPNTERWDRGNGRIYRLLYDSSYRPVQVDLARLEDLALAELHGHRNEWHVRTARRVLHERSLERPLAARAVAALRARAEGHADPVQRLRAIWTLYLTREWSEDRLVTQLRDSDPYVRGWAIQLLTESVPASELVFAELFRLAENDRSPVVRRYLASAIQRVPEGAAWKLTELLADHGEDASDRNLPWLLWQGLAPLLPSDWDRAFRLAGRTPIAPLADYVYWYAGMISDAARERVVAGLSGLEGEALHRRLAGLELSLSAKPQVAQPDVWQQVRASLYQHDDPRVRQRAERLAAAFQDESVFPQLREILEQPSKELAARRHALAVLSRAQDRSSVPVFIKLLDEPSFRFEATRLLARFDAPEIADALIARLAAFKPAERSEAVHTLISRAVFARPLLDAVAAKQIGRDLLTAFHVRQLLQLGDPEIDRRVTEAWGKVGRAPAERQVQIDRLEKVFTEAPLWAYDAREGRKHFTTLCASCHKVGEEGARIGPELTGAGKNGIRYFLENILDPDAVIGADYRMTQVDMKDGELIAGLLASETPDSIVLRTVGGEVVIATDAMAGRITSEKSMMPEGLIDPLGERELLELLKFLTSN